MSYFSRRAILFLFFPFLVVTLTGCNSLFDYLGGGKSSGNPAEMRAEFQKTKIGKKALKLIDEAYKIEGDIVDQHVHIIGSGGSVANLCPEIKETGIYINKNRFQPLKHPILYGKTQVMMSSAKVSDVEKADEESAQRLLELVKVMPENTKFNLLALDWYRDENGSPNKDKTDLFIPNDYVLKLRDCMNRRVGRDAFISVISVHPLDPKFAEVLDEYYAQGVRAVKWLPNSMNINPADKRNIPFYQKMASLEGMVLISHTGFEDAINVADGREAQHFGSPDRIELALEHGVTVLLSHSGGETRYKDDYPQNHIDTFVDMMKKTRQNNWKLYGDISALTIKKNVDHFGKIIGNPDMQGRMLYGSDYPLPAIYFLYNGVCTLVKRGYLDKDLEEPLKLIFQYNPLIFDFVLKRNIHLPDNPNLKLPEEVFQSLQKL